ncbi:hypothetical protein BRW84_06880 [Oxalobacter formigenes OXCC13]|nr:hypothetical protein BRW84_06880 [Oxalobacter formigenes OXCC13]
MYFSRKNRLFFQQQISVMGRYNSHIILKWAAGMLCFFYHVFHFFFKRNPCKEPEISPEELKKMQEDETDWNCWC